MSSQREQEQTLDLSSSVFNELLNLYSKLKGQHYSRDSYRLIRLQVLHILFAQAQEFFIGNCNYFLYFHVLCKETKCSDVGRFFFYIILAYWCWFLSYTANRFRVCQKSETSIVAGSLDQFHAWQSDWLHSFEKENNINVQNYSTPYRVALLYDHDVLYSYIYGAMKWPTSQPVIREFVVFGGCTYVRQSRVFF